MADIVEFPETFEFKGEPTFPKYPYSNESMEAAILSVPPDAKAEIVTLKTQLSQLREERDKLKGELSALVEKAKALCLAENIYRHNHDTLGGWDIQTGRAWDAMRRASLDMFEAMKDPKALATQHEAEIKAQGAREALSDALKEVEACREKEPVLADDFQFAVHSANR